MKIYLTQSSSGWTARPQKAVDQPIPIVGNGETKAEAVGDLVLQMRERLGIQLEFGVEDAPKT